LRSGSIPAVTPPALHFFRPPPEAFLAFRIVRSNISPAQPNPKPESLDELIAKAEHYANYSMRNVGRLPPTLFLIGPDGPLMFMPESLADENAKDDFANNARLTGHTLEALQERSTRNRGGAQDV